MACSLEAVSVDKLEGLLSCSICLETLKDPRTLPCFHSYCKSCLERFVKNHRDKAVGRQMVEFNCPNCRSEFTLNPGDEVADMMPNHFVCNMLDVMAVQERVKVLPCSHCQRPSIGRCVTCEVFLCQECLTVHNNYRGFKNHSVLSMDELSKPENQSNIRGKLYCKEHSKKALKFYCETCSELICRYCMDFNHLKANHSCHPAEKVADQQKKLLVSACSTLSKELNRGKNALQAISDVTQSLGNVKEEVKREISRRRDDILNAVTQQLNKEVERLMGQVEEIYSTKHDTLKKQKEEVKGYVDKLESCVNLSTELLEKGTDEEILSSIKMIKENMEKVQNENLKNLKPADNDKIHFKYDTTEKFGIHEIINKIGMVENSENLSYDRNCIKVQTIEVEGAFLTVNPIESSIVSTEDADVSKVWSWPRNYERPIENGDEDTGEQDFEDNKEERKVYREQKRTIDKQNRHEKYHEKRGHQEDSRATECLIFEDTKVKVKNWKKVVGENESKAKEMLEKEKVKLDEKGYLTGSWNAVLNVFHLLRSILYREDDASKSRYKAQSSSSELNCDVCKQSILVEALLFRYINTFRGDVYRALEDVSKEIRFQIISSSERQLKVVARGDVDDQLFREKYNKFINCYQELYPDMREKVITLHSTQSESPPIADIVSETQGKFAVIVTFCQEKYQITVYGKKEVVSEASSFINGRVRGISKESKNVGTENRNGQLMYNLSKNVKLFVYQGDITEEKTDAIVNPANEDLHHCGGAAKAILDRGGKSIQDESDGIMKGRRGKPLQPGDVEITKAGNLPCKFVVHAVGPRSYHHSAGECRKLLQKAVWNSLKTASQNIAQTIAIPAISSGVFNVPVKLCAEVLFDTVQEFAKSATDSEILQEIRFVNIDKQTTQVFEKEMRKRYGDAVSGGKETRNQNGHGPMNKGEKSTAIVHYHNDTSRENVPFGQGRGQGRGRGAQQNNNGGNERKGNNPRPGDQPIPNASAKENSSIKHPPGTYSEVAKRDNTVTDDTSKCPICLDAMTNPKKLSKCGHSFCTACIDNAFKHQTKCPICSEVYGVLTGNQPPGQMKSHSSYTHFLPGFQRYGIIVINYNFPDGTQGQNHPHPGRPFTGTRREAYLPDNKEGQKVLRLLNKAFIQKLTFTIGRSSTTGVGDTVTWNDIHHKTNWSGGPTNFGYPDASYLKRVQEELAAKGIKE